MSLGMAMGARRRSLSVPGVVGLPVTDGLVLDLDATKLNLNDNDPVATWPDESGLGNDATQGTASAQPTYRTDILNGQPVVRFDGTDDKLLVPYSVHGGSLEPDSVSVFVLTYVHANSEQASGLISTAYEDDFRPGYAVFHRDTEWEWRISNGAQVDVTGSLTRSNFVLLTATFDHTDQLQVLYEDGAQLGFESSATLGYDTNPLQLGAWFDGKHITGDIAQVIIYDRALTTQERDDVEAHLMSKWGLA